MSDTLIFNDFGYVDAHQIKGIGYSQVKLAISKKITETRRLIKDKEDELSKIKMYLSNLEYEDRTIWLLYQDDRPPERRVLG